VLPSPSTVYESVWYGGRAEVAEDYLLQDVVVNYDARCGSQFLGNPVGL